MLRIKDRSMCEKDWTKVDPLVTHQVWKYFYRSGLENFDVANDGLSRDEFEFIQVASEILGYGRGVWTPLTLRMPCHLMRESCVV